VKPAIEDDRLHLAQIEIRHLQNTIQALRGQLEALQADKSSAVQAAVTAGSNEARQLQATIQALRVELEQAAFRHADESEQARRTAQDELRLLRETISKLRDELEKNRPSNS
jgi:chromosome segregation ATPase